jgi:hypothetical protein
MKKSGGLKNAKGNWRLVLDKNGGIRPEILVDESGMSSGSSHYGETMIWAVLLSIMTVSAVSAYLLVAGFEKVRRAEQTIGALGMSDKSTRGASVSTNGSPSSFVVSRGRGMALERSFGSLPAEAGTAERKGALTRTSSGEVLSHVATATLSPRREKSLLEAGIEPPVIAPKVQAAPGPFASRDESSSRLAAGAHPAFVGMLFDGGVPSSSL